MESNKCVLCLRKCSVEDRFKNVTGNIGWGDKVVSVEGVNQLKDQLPVIFLLRRILQMPKDICFSFLNSFGNPCLWIKCCDTCSLMVDDAKGLFDHIKVQQNRYDKLQKDIKQTLLLSLSAERNIATDSDPEVHKAVRSYFRKEADTLPKKKKVKTEVCSNESNLGKVTDEAGTNGSVIDVQQNAATKSGGSSVIKESNTVADLNVEASTFEIELHNKKTWHKCDICKKHFLNVDILKEHKKVHTASEFHKKVHSATASEPPKCDSFKCENEKCGKHFSVSSNLTEKILPHEKTCEGKTRRRKQQLSKYLYTDDTPPTEVKTESPDFGEISWSFINNQMETSFETERNENEGPDSVTDVNKETSTVNVEESEENDKEGERYKCDMCTEEFKELDLLREHMIREQLNKHLKNRRYVCDICDKGFPSRKRIAQHRKVHTDDCDCKICLVHFSAPQYLKSHMQSHKTETSMEEKFDEAERKSIVSRPVVKKRYERKLDKDVKAKEVAFDEESPVDVAELDVDEEESLIADISEKEIELEEDEGSHVEKGDSDKSFDCTICGNIYPYASSLKYHIGTGHSEDEINEYYAGVKDKLGKKCEFCGKYLFPSKLAIHMKIHKKENPFCGKAISSKKAKEELDKNNTDLNTKVITLDEDAPGPVETEECENYEVIWEEEVGCEEDSKEETKKLHKCKICGKDFKKISLLKAHVQRHNKETQYPCKVCGKLFYHKKYVKDHENIHLGVKPYKCNICSQSFAQMAQLKSHRRKHMNFRPHVCQKCGMSFTAKGSLNRHLFTHTEERRFKCKMCGKNYRQHEGLKFHMENHHGCTSKKYECATCGKNFLRGYSLTIHERSHNNIPECKPCGITFENKLGYSKHITEYHPGQKEFVCEVCGKSLSRESTLKYHLKTHEEGFIHGLRRSRHKCGICVKTFRCTESLKSHMHTHIEENLFPCKLVPGESDNGEVSYKCDICEKVFTDLDLIKKHMIEEEILYACKTCGIRFALPQNLKLHMMEVHNKEISEDEIILLQQPKQDASKSRGWKSLVTFNEQTNFKLHKCEICDKSFLNISNLRTHTRTHTGVKSFECELCGKLFTTATSLAVHKRIHSGEKPFMCEFCGKAFTSIYYSSIHKNYHCPVKMKEGNRTGLTCGTCGRIYRNRSSFRVHLKTHTGEKVKVEKVKRYKCQTCDKNFLHPRTLKQHLFVHTGEKPYVCDVCGKSFRFPGSLTLHKRLHTGEKPFKCDFCDKLFSNGQNLKYHRRVHTHTGEKPYPCKQCDKKFSATTSLNRHLITHTGEKRYKCKECPKSFTQAYTLTVHSRKHE